MLADSSPVWCLPSYWVEQDGLSLTINNSYPLSKGYMYKRLHILICFTFFLGACAVTSPEPTSTPVPSSTPTPAPYTWDSTGWNLVWQDEFEGTKLDKTNWTFDLGSSGWGNAEWETYTDKPENVRV